MVHPLKLASMAARFSACCPFENVKGKAKSIAWARDENFRPELIAFESLNLGKPQQVHRPVVRPSELTSKHGT